MDIRTVSRFVGAACLVVGPAAVTIGTLTAPVGDGDPPATALAKVTAHPGAQRFTIAVGLFAILLVPAMVYLTRMARRGAPWLATIGGGLAFLGWLAALMSLAALDVVNYHAAQLTDRGAAVALLQSLTDDPALGVLILLFVVGHLVGMLLLGIALWRSRAVPVWVAALVGLAPIAHLFARGAGAVPDAATMALLTVGMAGCALRLLRVPDAEWAPTESTAPERAMPPVPEPAR